MRDFLLILIIFGSIPFILVRPQFGILMWTWISYMNPHRLTWGVAYDLPVGLIIGSVIIVAWVLSREPKHISWDSIPVMMLAFVLWTNFTTIFALNPGIALREIIQFDKIIFMTFLAMVIMHTAQRVTALIAVMVCSIGYFSVKGGLFSVLTGFQYTVFGPTSSFIQENNAMAMATIMILPLMYYFSTIVSKSWARWAIRAACVLSVFSVIGSYSRGAIVGALLLGIFWLWRSQYRILLAVLIGGVMVVTIPFIPGKWFERMETIETYDTDRSAMGRIHQWEFAIDLASSRPLVGGGFGVFGNQRIFNQYSSGGRNRARAAHSIYFQVLGTQGFVGLFLFLGMGFAGIRATRWMKKQTKGRAEFRKEYQLANYLGLTFVAYGSCGAFLSLATWDLPYTLLAVTHLAKIQLISKLEDNPSAQSEISGGFESGRTPANKTSLQV